MNMIFTRPKREMNSYLCLIGLVLVGFLVYSLLRDKLFDIPDITTISEAFSKPAPAEIEIRQAPLYPERTISASGPNPPNQATPSSEIVTYGNPIPKDPYAEQNESSDIPENLRHPERSFRPPPLNNNSSLATQSGIASYQHQVSSDNSVQTNPEMIQGGGEFMPGIYANDTFNDSSFSAF
jgi:hypothetical protein